MTREFDMSPWDAAEAQRAKLIRDYIIVSLVFGFCIGFVTAWMIAAQVMRP